MGYIVRLGAVWLGIVGAWLLIAAFGLALVGIASNESVSGLDTSGLIALALIPLVVGAPHMTAAVGVWRRRTWGRWLGAGLGGVGLVVALFGVSVNIAQGGTGIVLLAPVAVGYGLALVGSVMWYPTDPPAPT